MAFEFAPIPPRHALVDGGWAVLQNGSIPNLLRVEMEYNSDFCLKIISALGESFVSAYGRCRDTNLFLDRIVIEKPHLDRTMVLSVVMSAIFTSDRYFTPLVHPEILTCNPELADEDCGLFCSGPRIEDTNYIVPTYRRAFSSVLVNQEALVSHCMSSVLPVDDHKEKRRKTG